MTELDVGPIDYLALEFPAAKLDGSGMQALLDLVEAGTIRVLDLRVVVADEDGTLSAVAIADLDGDGVLDLAVFEGVESGLLDQDDIDQIGSIVTPGNAVGLIVYENTWAGPFVTAMRQAGAQVVASGRIPADDVLAALDRLDSESAPA
ncbi:MAG: DUF1269 domain-containing protein [Marmoricola sp.]|nr:DUF1269 domain-containing protein [Marmoricola sp.]